MVLMEVHLTHSSEDGMRVFYLEEELIRHDVDAAFDIIKSNAQQMVFGMTLQKITYMDDEGDDCTLSRPSMLDALEFCEDTGKVRVLKLKIEAIESSPPCAAPEAETAPWYPVSATITHSRGGPTGAPIALKEMRDGTVAWCDRNYTYQHVPCEMVGSTLASQSHKPSGGGHFTVVAPAGAVVYIFSEAHRDGGFPALGWSKVEAGRFHWFCPKANRSWGMTAWKKVHDGGQLDIPTPDCLVGGVAIQMVKTDAPKQNPSAADKFIELLQTSTMGLDIRKVLPKLAKAMLHIIDDLQIPELFELLDPLVSLSEGSFDLDQLKFYAAMAIDIVNGLPKETKCQLAMRAHSALVATVQELHSETSCMEVHLNVVCDCCEQSPMLGPRHKCDICEDYDLCDRCHTRRHEIHPAHDKWTVVKSSNHADVVGFGFNCPNQCCPCITCDGCNKSPLTPDDRHKCAVCPDYDLCSDCFAQRATIHEHDSWVESPAHHFVMPAADVPLQSCSPAAEMEAPTTESPTLQVAKEDEQYKVHPKIMSAALSNLLEHPDEAIRSATRQAITNAMSAQGASESDCDDTVPTSDGEFEKLTEELMLEKDSTSEMSEDPKQTEEEEKEASEEKELEQASAESAKVVDASMSFGGVAQEAVFDLAEARGDVTEELQGLIAAYPNVNQAFRIGSIAILHSEPHAKAVAKVLVTNDGTIPWPEISALRVSAGPAYGFPEMELGAVPAGETVELVLELAFGPGEAGHNQASCWAMVDQDGKPFGPLLLLEVARV